MIAIEKQGAVCVIAPETPINAEHAEPFGDAVREQLRAGLPQIVLDFSGVVLLDSAGLEAVLDARDAVRSRGGIIKLAGLTTLTADIVCATGISDYFEIFDNAKAAVGSFSR